MSNDDDGHANDFDDDDDDDGNANDYDDDDDDDEMMLQHLFDFRYIF